MLVEVTGMNKKDPGIITFDGKVIEIFGFGHKHASRRIHINQVMMLIEEDKALNIGYSGGMILVSYTGGCDNMNELVETVKNASPNPDLILK